jgi:hypothetical protein
MVRKAVLGRFVLGQHFARAHYDFVWQSRQLGDFDSVAAVGCARFDSAQKDYASAGLFDGDVIILSLRSIARPVRSARNSGWRKSLGAHSRMQIFDGGPGDRQAIVGGGAASDFI